MNEEERLAPPSHSQRIEDHFVEITEMGGTMPENLPPAESIKKLESQRRKQPKAPKRLAGETDTAGGLHEESRG